MMYDFFIQGGPILSVDVVNRVYPPPVLVGLGLGVGEGLGLGVRIRLSYSDFERKTRMIVRQN